MPAQPNANVFDQFDPDAYLKSTSGFDPDAYLRSQPTPPKNAFDQFDPPTAKAGDWDVVSTKPVGDWDVVHQGSPQPMSWSEVGSQALRNTPSSAVQFGSDILQPFIHPIDTASNLKNLGLGILDKVGIGSGEHAQYADAVGKFYADRYGGVENVKRALANDPVGVLGDLSMLLTGGESALARAPGIVGKAGEIAGAAGRAVDPLRAAAGAGKAIAKGAGYVGAEGLGLTTGAGSEPIRIAARSGYEGGEAGNAFRENMRGLAPIEDAVEDARKAVGQMRQERGNAYRTAMQDIGMDQKVLNFDEIDDALRQAGGVKTFKGGTSRRARRTSAISSPTWSMSGARWTRPSFTRPKGSTH